MIATPRIETLATKKLVGKSVIMSLSENKTPELWKSFMQERRLITNAVSNDLISMQVYDKELDFKDFTSSTLFEKWATTEVTDFDKTPSTMKAFVLEGGLYAVFIYKGLVSNFHKTAQYIFGEWLPNSNYDLDQRPHFEILGEKYKNNDVNSEEEVWVPIRLKSK